MNSTSCSAPEYIILVNEQDKETGYAEKLSAHQQNLLHRAFSIFIFREGIELELLLQQRALHKYHSPGLWTNACCSHPHPGEDILTAGIRRLEDELGTTTSLKHLGWFHYCAHFPNGLSENEIDHVLVGMITPNQKIIPNQEEINAYRWVTVKTVDAELIRHPHQFTPWFCKALAIVKAGLKI